MSSSSPFSWKCFLFKRVQDWSHKSCWRLFVPSLSSMTKAAVHSPGNTGAKKKPVPEKIPAKSFNTKEHGINWLRFTVSNMRANIRKKLKTIQKRLSSAWNKRPGSFSFLRQKQIFGRPLRNEREQQVSRECRYISFCKKTGIIKFRFANVIAFCNNKVLHKGLILRRSRMDNSAHGQFSMQGNRR